MTPEPTILHARPCFDLATELPGWLTRGGPGLARSLRRRGLPAYARRWSPMDGAWWIDLDWLSEAAGGASRVCQRCAAGEVCAEQADELPPGFVDRVPGQEVFDPDAPARRRAASVLGVDPSAGSAAVVAAFRRAALATHPDRPGGGDPEAFRQAVAARDALLPAPPRETF